MSIEDNKLKNILEAALMAVGKPMTIEQIMKLFGDDERPSATRVKEALSQLQQDCEGRGIELKEIASGYRYQARQDYSDWLSRLWEEKPAKYSRAYLETLALIAYRQPVTRAEIEEVRGVSVSSNIVKTMLEREWIRVVGHRDVPGRPSLYATTKQFLDYFNMKSLEELPSLAEIKDLEELSPELNLPEPGQQDEQNDAPAGAAENEASETESGGINTGETDTGGTESDEVVSAQDETTENQLDSNRALDNSGRDSTEADESMEAAIADYNEEMREIQVEEAEYEAGLSPAESESPFEESPFEESAFEDESFEDENYRSDIGEVNAEQMGDNEQSEITDVSENGETPSDPQAEASDLSEENQSV